MSVRLTYRIDSEIFKKFPDARVGVGLARIIVEKTPSDKVAAEFLSNLKQGVVQKFIKDGITSENYLETSACQSWRRVFTTYGVSDDKQCTLNHLFKRTAAEAKKILEAAEQGKKKKADMPRISNVVDLCNCIAIETHTPMGILDVNNISEGLTLRYGKDSEIFTAIGDTAAQVVQPSHIVLADHQGVLAYLWTHKVSERACVRGDESKKEAAYVLVCSDQAEKEAGDARAAVNRFFECLPKINGEGAVLGVADKDHPEVHFEIPQK